MEVVDTDLTLSLGTANQNRRAEDFAHRRQVLSGVGLAQRATDCAAVAHDRIGDHPLGVGEDRGCPEKVGRRQHLGVPGHRAQARLRRGDLDVAELAMQVVDVDEVLGIGDPEFHHRQQAVPAGNDHRPFTKAVQETDSVVDTGGAFVLKRIGNLHVTDLTTTTER